MAVFRKYYNRFYYEIMYIIGSMCMYVVVRIVIMFGFYSCKESILGKRRVYWERTVWNGIIRLGLVCVIFVWGFRVYFCFFECVNGFLFIVVI